MGTIRVLATLGTLAAVAGGIALYAGWYDISATDQHLKATYLVLDTGMRRSVRQRGEDIAVPPLDAPALAEKGFALYRRHCEQCHGGPGVAPEPFALGMTPTPNNLVHTAREWPAGDLFWVVSEGIKMTGMPAWRFRMNEEEMWAVVAFLRRLPHLTPTEYQARRNSLPLAEAATSLGAPPSGSDAQRGRRAIHQYGCLTCHQIAGLTGANAPVGPPLAGIARRRVIAGTLENTPANLVLWLRSPQSVNPGSAMPDLGLTERDARDIAAFLATLD